MWWWRSFKVAVRDVVAGLVDNARSDDEDREEGHSSSDAVDGSS